MNSPTPKWDPKTVLTTTAMQCLLRGMRFCVPLFGPTQVEGFAKVTTGGFKYTFRGGKAQRTRKATERVIKVKPRPEEAVCQVGLPVMSKTSRSKGCVCVCACVSLLFCVASGCPLLKGKTNRKPNNLGGSNDFDTTKRGALPKGTDLTEDPCADFHEEMEKKEGEKETKKATTKKQLQVCWVPFRLS